MEKCKTLSDLIVDKRKANQDLARLSRQTVMIQGVITYLDQEIAKLEAKEEVEDGS